MPELHDPDRSLPSVTGGIAGRAGSGAPMARPAAAGPVAMCAMANMTLGATHGVHASLLLRQIDVVGDNPTRTALEFGSLAFGWTLVAGAAFGIAVTFRRAGRLPYAMLIAGLFGGGTALVAEVARALADHQFVQRMASKYAPAPAPWHEIIPAFSARCSPAVVALLLFAMTWWALRARRATA